MEISSIVRDVATIEAGQWVDDIPGMGDLRLKVRGIGSKVFTAKQARLARAVPRDQRGRDGNVNTETATRIIGEAMFGTILLDWEGLTDNGAPVPFDEALAKKWLTEPEYRPFMEAVTFAANVVENGTRENKEQVAKN